MSAWMADNHPRLQAEGVRLALSQCAGGSDGCVDGSQSKQEGASENGAERLWRFCLGWVQISELPLGKVNLWAFWTRYSQELKTNPKWDPKHTFHVSISNTSQHMYWLGKLGQKQVWERSNFGYNCHHHAQTPWWCLRFLVLSRNRAKSKKIFILLLHKTEKAKAGNMLFFFQNSSIYQRIDYSINHCSFCKNKKLRLVFVCIVFSQKLKLHCGFCGQNAGKGENGLSFL